MSDKQESRSATVARLRDAARNLIALIEKTPDRAQRHLLAVQAFELLRQSAQLAQQAENTQGDSVTPPVLRPKKADT